MVRRPRHMQEGRFEISMTTTLIDIPDDLLARVQQVYGTRGKRDTVVRALEESVAAEARRRLIERLRTMRGLDLDDPEVMRQAWR